MAEVHKVRRSAGQPVGTPAPKRRSRRSPSAAVGAPKVKPAPPTESRVIDSAPQPTVEAPPSSPPNVVAETPVQPVDPIPEPVSAAVSVQLPEPEMHPETFDHVDPSKLANERLVWAVSLVVSWSVTVVALLRLFGTL